MTEELISGVVGVGGGTGTFAQSGGANVVGFLLIGQTTQGTYTMTGGTLTATTYIQIANRSYGGATGTMTVANATVTTPQLVIGSTGDTGTVTINAGGQIIAGNLQIQAGGTLNINGGKLKVTGSITGLAPNIGAHGTLELAAAYSAQVDFDAGEHATLLLDMPAQFTGTLAGVENGDIIDFAGINVIHAAIIGSNINVTVAGNQTFAIGFSGSLTSDTVSLRSDGNGGSNLILGPATTRDDFNGDGRSDILWSNTSGDTAIWTATGSGGFTNADLGLIPTSWQVVGTGDFNGNGDADILWRNTNGDTNIWASNGSGGFASSDLGIIDTSWQLAGTGDFNGNGLADILWHNSNGDGNIWYSNGSGGFSSTDLGVVPTNWQISGTGDFHRQRVRRYSLAQPRRMATRIFGNRPARAASPASISASSQRIGRSPAPAISPATGTDDILWRNTTNGDTTLWEPTGSGNFTSVDLGIIGTSWSIAGVGDFNGNGNVRHPLAQCQWRHKYLEFDRRLRRLHLNRSRHRPDELECESRVSRHKRGRCCLRQLQISATLTG